MNNFISPEEYQKMKKTLSEQFEEILFFNWDKRNDTNREVLDKLIKAVKERDAFVIGESEGETANDTPEGIYNSYRNALRKEQHKRAEESL